MIRRPTSGKISVERSTTVRFGGQRRARDGRDPSRPPSDHLMRKRLLRARQCGERSDEARENRQNDRRDRRGRDQGQARENQQRDNQGRDNQGRDNQGRDNQGRDWERKAAAAVAVGGAVGIARTGVTGVVAATWSAMTSR